MNLTLFLGAGFSVPFGHPAMNSFLGFADGCARLTKEEKAFLGQLVLEARRANSFLQSSPTNIEDILSFSEMGERLELTQESEARSGKLREIIRKIFTTVPSVRDYWRRYAPLEQLIRGKPKKFGEFLSIITTNYDLNAESACISLECATKLNFPFERLCQGMQSVAGRLYADVGVPLYKLHGSVNWYVESGVLKVEDRVVRVNGGRDDQSPPCLPYSCVNDYYNNQSSPTIIPPSFLKPELAAPLRAVWAGAAQALSKASVVAFIGYSFPPSDTEMMYFLARALSENTGLRKIIIVDPKADEIASRLRSAPSKMGSHFQEFLEPISKNWVHAELPI